MPNTEACLAQQRMWNGRKRATETSAETETTLADQSSRAAQLLSMQKKKAMDAFEGAAFRYDPAAAYGIFPAVAIGTMSQVCTYRNTLKWKSETNATCCSIGKVKLPELADPAEPLRTLLLGES